MSALVTPARAAESQASDFWVSVSSVDVLDLVHEASLQRRESFFERRWLLLLECAPAPAEVRLVRCPAAPALPLFR